MLAISVSKKQKICPTIQHQILMPMPYVRSHTSSMINDTLPEAERNVQSNKQEAQKTQGKTFKIRTFSTKNNPNKHNAIEGKKLIQICPVQFSSKHEDGTKQGKNHHIYRRPSIQIKNDESVSLNRNKTSTIANLKKRKNKDSTIFQEIQIFKNLQKTTLNFKTIDMTSLGSLAHRPIIKQNLQLQNNNQQFILIISMSVLNFANKKYISSQQRSNQSQKIIQEIYSIQISNYLKSLCGIQSNSSFLNYCKLYFKVASSIQSQKLQKYLTDNNLERFSGIIDVHNRFSQTYNFYNLKEITSKQTKLIIIEDEQTLKYQMPIFQKDEVMFICPKTVNHLSISQMIKNLREIELQQIRQEKNDKSSYLLKKTQQLMDDCDKQNLHPNIGFKTFISTKQSNRKIKQCSPSPNRKLTKTNIIFPSSLPIKKLQIQASSFIEKAKHAVQSRLLKQTLKEKRNVSARGVSRQKVQDISKAKNNQSIDRSINYQKNGCKQQNSPLKIQLEGDFKQKMVKYAKILQNQRMHKSKSNSSQNNTFKLQKHQSKSNDLDELTACLTSRQKSKTPFQLVGDLLRSNNHIAKQIGKYMNKIKIVKDLYGIGEREDSRSLSRQGRSVMSLNNKRIAHVTTEKQQIQLEFLLYQFQ